VSGGWLDGHSRLATRCAKERRAVAMSNTDSDPETPITLAIFSGQRTSRKLHYQSNPSAVDASRIVNVMLAHPSGAQKS